MTNQEYIQSLSKDELAVLVSQMLYDMNDYVLFINDIYKWLGEEVEFNDKAMDFSEIAEIYIKKD